MWLADNIGESPQIARRLFRPFGVWDSITPSSCSHNVFSPAILQIQFNRFDWKSMSIYTTLTLIDWFLISSGYWLRPLQLNIELPWPLNSDNFIRNEFRNRNIISWDWLIKLLLPTKPRTDSNHTFGKFWSIYMKYVFPTRPKIVSFMLSNSVDC